MVGLSRMGSKTPMYSDGYPSKVWCHHCKLRDKAKGVVGRKKMATQYPTWKLAEVLYDIATYQEDLPDIELSSETLSVHS